MDGHNLELDELVVGNQYDRREVVRLFALKGNEVFVSGVICPEGMRDIVVLTHEGTRTDVREYNRFDGELLIIEGRKDHLYDDRLVASPNDNSPVRFFFRHEGRASFTYFGLVRLDSYELGSSASSRFYFKAIDLESVTDQTGGPSGEGSIDPFLGPEGQRRLAKHVTYERDPKNREAALRKHGCACLVCGLNFDKAYGLELARSYIEVHHTVSITKLDGKTPSIDDLIPLCANCHRMAHRRFGEIVRLEELKEIYQSRNT